ncbi:hypothetical protein A2372_01745 [Candidatus Wolfebacteria bacterium RIFOXYB1_FULL_54_12]|uniref:Uncharacterized protein n=1 Tax=Candidatus Wolfebacteria bacterium RIFOXYB1_FULL_54_12 TaxID=1802559 RepID=A0A1F8DX37_9BACT|nr:MAG: hypothetical protein A2372_01745 [Candidatus Wolfebacteria bacterium RIFOXYB1_FULL_54_12]
MLDSRLRGNDNARGAECWIPAHVKKVATFHVACFAGMTEWEAGMTILRGYWCIDIVYTLYILLI